MKKKLIVIALLLSGVQGFAQYSVRDSSIRFVMLSGSLAGQVPAGDMAKRFGLNGNVGVHVQYKSRTNWLLGAEGNYMYGNMVNSAGLLDSISTRQGGYVINDDGDFAGVQLFEQGFTLMFTAGKILPVWAYNPNSGLTVKFGAGVMEHWIGFTGIGGVPQLNGEYQKGYDRLTSGYCYSEFIGYTFFSNKRLINFFCGLEFYEGFTRSRRIVDFTTMRYDATKRGDFLYGIRFGWIIPLYKKVPKDYYYN